MLLPDTMVFAKFNQLFALEDPRNSLKSSAPTVVCKRMYFLRFGGDRCRVALSGGLRSWGNGLMLVALLVWIYCNVFG